MGAVRAVRADRERPRVHREGLAKPIVKPEGLTPRSLPRRDLLRLGPSVAAALAAGCRSQTGLFPDRETGSGRITGSIVGASHEAGHRLRDGGLPEPQETRAVPVLIVGAGIAGLSAGWKLAKSGFRDFEILELESEPGGNSRWGENGVSAYPWGAHYLPVPTSESTAVRELLEEMGMVRGVGPDGEPVYDPRHLCHVPQERLFIDGRWREGISARELLSSSPETGDGAVLAEFEQQMKRYRDYRDARGRRAFALPMALSSDDPDLVALDRISMREYFDRAGWKSERLRWYVDHCCRDDYGCTLETTSAWAGWHYFCSRGEDAEYLTWPEGNGRIVRHMVERLERHLHTGTLVYRIRVTGGPAAGEASAEGADVDVLDTRTNAAVRIRARQVIYALPRFTAPYVLDGYELPGIDTFSYAPWMVANLTVDRLPEGAAWDNVIYDSLSLGYVVATHQNLRAAPGPSVLTYYMPLAAPNPEAVRRWMLERSWDDWVAIILGDLAPAHVGLESLVTQIDIMLWGHAMIRPVPGFLWGEARRRAAAAYGPVRFAHSDMSGFSLFEEAQYQGVRAAEDLMRHLGHAYRSSLGPAEGV